MWNGSIRLPVYKTGSQDKDGFIQDEHCTYTSGIPASFTDVTRSDETLAAQKGYSAHQNIEIMACNYHGETHLIDEMEGTIYDIRRTFRGDKSMRIVLTCERRDTGGIHH